MVGIQYHDEALVGYLETNRIPFVKLEGRRLHQGIQRKRLGPATGRPRGQKDVAERIYGMLSTNGVVRANSASTK